MNCFHIFLFIIVINMNWHCHAFKVKSLLNNKTYPGEDFSDTYLSSFELINKYGYQPEKHTVITEDSYIVNLFRLPRNGPPVLLAHGIADSSDSWLVLGPSESLAFMLADAGFDVWLYNARGNKYSKDHAKNVTGKTYWDFSFEELGLYDLPATIDYILSTTARAKISYIGFSQGTTIFFVMCSSKPEYNSKIEQAILLAPVAWLNNIRLPYAKYFARNLDTLMPIFDALNLHEMYPDSELLNRFHATACRPRREWTFICNLEYLVAFGIRNPSNISPDKFPIITSHVPAGCSTKSLVHYLQSYISRRFSRYDYGPIRNQVRYKSKIPPAYNVSSITAPISMFFSEEDWFSSVENYKLLKKALPNVVRSIVFERSLDFTHIEFTYGARVKTMVNDVIIKILLNKG